MSKYLITLIMVPLLLCLAVSGCRPQAAPGEKVSSELLQLATSANPGEFAKEHGMALVDGSIEVIIVVRDGISDLDDFSGQIRRHRLRKVMKNGDLISASVPVRNIVPLSAEKSVKYIKRPRKFWKM